MCDKNPSFRKRFCSSAIKILFRNKYMSVRIQNEIPHTHISQLPQQGLQNIFKYLTEADRRAASEACSSWFLAARISRFTKGQYVTLCHRDFQKNSPPNFIHKNSRFCHQNFQFNDVDVKYLNEFGDDMGQRIKLLVLFDKYTNKIKNIEFLKKFSNLEKLMINLNCHYGIRKSIPTGLEFPYLHTLDFTKTANLTYELFNVLTQNAPALEEIILASCGIHQKRQSTIADVSSGDTALIPSRQLFTYLHLHKFLSLRASSIKHLNISNTISCNEPLDVSFLTIEHLRLQTLDISWNNFHIINITEDTIFDIAKYQFHLKKLNLDHIYSITDKALQYISTHLLNLEHLSLSSAYNITDLGIVELQNLKKLKSLSLNKCSNITGNSFIYGICRETNLILEELDISFLNKIYENDFLLILQKLPNLKFLNVNDLNKEFTDRVIQTITQHQTLLKVLLMSSNFLVTDAGFIGVNNALMKNRKEKDALCLARLKQLTYLNLSGLNNLTDRTLKYALISTKLQKLNLSYCTSITPKGFKYLWKNCPNLKTLDIRSCNITDCILVEMATNLKCLRTLYITSCSQVSDKAVNALGKIRRIVTDRKCKVTSIN